MECPPIRAQAWLDDHERDLEGLDVESAVALIESADLHARVVPHRSGWMTQEQRRDRINLWLSASGAIGSIDAG
jgi:hypothetical protein